MNKGLLIFCIVYFLAAVVFGSIGIGIGKRNKRRLEQCTAQTIAKVAEIIRTSDSVGSDPGGTLFHPVFEYNAGSHCYRETYSFGMTRCRYKAGDEVVLDYNPDKPTQYVVESDKTPQILSVVFTCVGAFLLLTLIVVIIVCKVAFKIL